MNHENQSFKACACILCLAFLSGGTHAQDVQVPIQEKMAITGKELTEKRSRELLFSYKDLVAKTILSSESKSDKLRLYSAASSVLRSMLDKDYDPHYNAPTSTRLPDPTRSSGSDPGQITEPDKRQQATAARNALAVKIEKHNFQRDLRKELASIALRASAEVGATSGDTAIEVRHKLEEAGLSSAEASAILGEGTPATSPAK